MNELGIEEKDVSTLRSWKAYYVFMSAYYRRHPHAETKYVGEFLAKRAASQAKKINFEFPSRNALTEYMAQMSAGAENQYISWLLTYLDEQDHGLNDQSPFDWKLAVPPT